MRVIYIVISNEAVVFPNGPERNPLTLKCGGNEIAYFLNREQADKMAVELDGRVIERTMNELDYSHWENYLASLAEPVKDYKIRVSFSLDTKERSPQKAENNFWLEVREDSGLLHRLVKDNLVVVENN